MSGQFVIVLVPSASSDAAISFKTLFFAPPTATSPDNRFPPVTTNRSLTRASVNSAVGRVSFLGHLLRYGFPMAVHLTRIYTRTGDDGTTGLSDFSRVSKNDARLAAYADCDETNAALGAAVALGNPDEQILTVLRQIQNDLFDAGADLSTPVVANPEYPPLRISQSYIDRLEKWCDEFNESLPALNSFVLPGGSPLSALLHVARTVARRAERSAWVAVETHGDTISVLPAKYLNRLSDLLFILSRVANPDGDVLWQPGGPATG
jgi:cob(I)alamin adenosyltransferase